HGGASVVQSTAVVTPTAAAATPSTASDGDDGDGKDSSGGLSASSKRVVIGVVVGVGGAVILGVVGFVLWRLRRKNTAPGTTGGGSGGGLFGFRRRRDRDDEDLMNGGMAVGALGSEMPMPMAERAPGMGVGGVADSAPGGRFSDTTPFKDALDQYHHDAGPVTQASNF
ncbi:hypothetical protein KEM52_002565, partial [Ascosphaera acerosa]